jgi:hypothetical protein
VRCLLFEWQARRVPMLFTDGTPIAATDAVAPARRSPAANITAGRVRAPDDVPASARQRNTIQTQSARRARRHLPQVYSQTGRQHMNRAP